MHGEFPEAEHFLFELREDRDDREEVFSHSRYRVLRGMVGLSPSCQIGRGCEQFRTVIQRPGEFIMQYFAISGGTASPIAKKNVRPRKPRRKARSLVLSFFPGIQKLLWLEMSVQA